MFTKIFILFSLSLTALSDLVAPGIDRSIPDGAKSVSYHFIYGDQDMRIINEVVRDVEKSSNLKKSSRAFDDMGPLPAQDVKCLMSADKYCSNDMKQMKGVLIQAVKEDCKKCSLKQKERAGRIIASMMLHDKVAWKVFLTRYDGLKKVQRLLG